MTSIVFPILTKPTIIKDVAVPTEAEAASRLLVSVRPRERRREEPGPPPPLPPRKGFSRQFRSPSPRRALPVKSSSRMASQPQEVKNVQTLFQSWQHSPGGIPEGANTALKSPHRPRPHSKMEEKLQRRLAGSLRAAERPSRRLDGERSHP